MATTKDPAVTGGEPAIGIPYDPAAAAQGQYYYAPPPNPYAAGMPPPNAIYAGAPKGVPLQQTMFRDTPAPFHCQACGEAAVSTVR
jgi:lipopolysaccharide-induced tumor necrosis factor-alpha factor